MAVSLPIGQGVHSDVGAAPRLLRTFHSRAIRIQRPHLHRIVAIEYHFKSEGVCRRPRDTCVFSLCFTYQAAAFLLKYPARPASCPHAPEECKCFRIAGLTGLNGRSALFLPDEAKVVFGEQIQDVHVVQ